DARRRAGSPARRASGWRLRRRATGAALRDAAPRRPPGRSRSWRPSRVALRPGPGHVLAQDLAVVIDAPARDGLALRLGPVEIDASAAEHHETQLAAVAEHGHVLRRIAGDADQVGQPAGRHLADLAFEAQRPGTLQRRAADHVERRQADVAHEHLELAVVPVAIGREREAA